VDCITYSTTLPKQGSMRSGAISPQKPVALRTSGNGFSCWPTPGAQISNDGETPETWQARADKLKEKGINGNGAGMPLSIATLNWPTPRGEDSESCGNYPNATDSLTGATGQWATPNVPSRGAETDKSHRPESGGIDLQSQASLWVTNAMAGGSSSRGGDRIDEPLLGGQVQQWATPANRDYRSPNATSYQDRSDSTKGEQLVNHHFLPPDHKQTGDPSRKCSTRRLNPAFVCWLMGWPWWWTRAEPISFAAAEMASWRSRAQLHLSSLCGE
jgi:hypothetical protein